MVWGTIIPISFKPLLFQPFLLFINVPSAGKCPPFIVPPCPLLRLCVTAVVLLQTLPSTYSLKTHLRITKTSFHNYETNTSWLNITRGWIWDLLYSRPGFHYHKIRVNVIMVHISRWVNVHRHLTPNSQCDSHEVNTRTYFTFLFVEKVTASAIFTFSTLNWLDWNSNTHFSLLSSSCFHIKMLELEHKIKLQLQ